MIHPLIQKGRLLVVPGVFDALSARLAWQAGFPSAVLTGYGVAATHLGRPDVGLLTMAEVLDVARRIRLGVPELPLVVDGDTGFGGPLNVQRLVSELAAMGARGVILEDQTWPKRCGHLRDKSVVPAEEHAAKIRAAKEARGDARFLITARTDALAPLGLNEALRRARLYKEAGADVLFVEGPTTREQIHAIGTQLPPPLAINCIEGGVTPTLPLDELAGLSFFSVGFVLSPLFAVTDALRRSYAAIRSGSTEGLTELDFAGFDALIGAEEHLRREERFSAG